MRFLDVARVSADSPSLTVNSPEEAGVGVYVDMREAKLKADQLMCC